MRPKSEKHKQKDWFRNRGWRRVSWDDMEPWMMGRHMISYYNGKEARQKGNRAVRRYKDFIPNGSTYKKIYDVPWEIW